MQESLDYEQLPYSLEAEQSVLGALLLDPNCIGESFSYISQASFYSEKQMIQRRPRHGAGAVFFAKNEALCVVKFYTGGRK